MKMKRVIVITSIFLSVSILMPVYSQSSDGFEKGTNLISFGLGLGGNYTYFGNGYTSTPNFVLSYDNGTFGNVGPGTISLGGLLSYKGISYDYTDFHSGFYYNQSWTYFIIGIRSAYHLAIPSAPKFDPYAGLMLAYYDISWKESSNDPDFNVPGYQYYYANTYSGYVAFSLYIGARYFVTNKISIWLELGYGYTNAAIGISLKF